MLLGHSDTLLAERQSQESIGMGRRPGRLAPTPPVLVRLQELTRPRQVDKDGQHEAVERQGGERSKPERELDEKGHHKRHRYQQRKECLHFSKMST